LASVDISEMAHLVGRK